MFPWKTIFVTVLVATPLINVAPTRAELPGGGAIRGDDDLRSVWRVHGRHAFHAAAAAGSGFSLVSDGQDVGPGDWPVRTAGASDATVFRHPSGLTIVRQVRPLPEFEAVEYTLRLKNDSQAELPPLAAIRSLDLSFAGGLVDGLSVISSGGAAGDGHFPPKDFAVRRTPLDSASNTVTLGAEGGSPSRTCLPLFFIHNDACRAGLFMGDPAGVRPGLPPGRRGIRRSLGAARPGPSRDVPLHRSLYGPELRRCRRGGAGQRVEFRPAADVLSCVDIPPTAVNGMPMRNSC